MSPESPGARAVALYELEDIFLIECQCHSDSEFNPTQVIPVMPVQQQLQVGKSVLLQRRSPVDGSADILIVRYLVSGRLALNNPGDSAQRGSDDTKPRPFAELALTFAADYRCPGGEFPKADEIGAFRRNVALHVWPYVREAVSDFASRMRLPRVTVPMMKPNPPASIAESSPAGHE